MFGLVLLKIQDLLGSLQKQTEHLGVSEDTVGKNRKANNKEKKKRKKKKTTKVTRLLSKTTSTKQTVSPLPNSVWFVRGASLCLCLSVCLRVLKRATGHPSHPQRGQPMIIKAKHHSRWLQQLNRLIPIPLEIGTGRHLP